MKDHISGVDPEYIFMLSAQPVLQSSIWIVESKWRNVHVARAGASVYPRATRLEKIDISDVPRNDVNDIVLLVEGGFFTFRPLTNEAYKVYSGDESIGLIVGTNGLSESVTDNYIIS